MDLSRCGTSALQRILTAACFFIIGCTSSSKTADLSPTLTVVNGESMLLGPMTQQALFDHFTIFREYYDAYVPKDETVALLTTYPHPTDVRIFVGTWCIDSKRHLPPFLRIVDSTANPRLTYSLFGLDRTKRDADGIAIRYGITRVPTMIFFQNDREIGRITERPTESVERDMVKILFGSTAD